MNNKRPPSCNTEIDRQSGLLGMFFGSPKHAPTNIAGLVLILVIVVGCLISYKDGTRLLRYLDEVCTRNYGGLGFLFGKRA